MPARLELHGNAGAARADAQPFFFVVRADGYLTFASPALAAYLGLSGDRIKAGRHVARFVRTRDLRMLARHGAAGRLELNEHVDLRSAGKTFARFRLCAQRMPVDERYRAWVGFCVATDRLGRLAPAATTPTLTLRSVMSGNDCVELLGLDERVWAMSMNGAQMPEINVDAAGRWSEFWSIRDRPAAARALADARSGGVGRFEARVPAGTATATWWDVVVTPVLGSDGDPESLLAISRDVTRTKELETKLGFLAESGKVLGSSLEPERTLARIAELAVRDVVAWCAISWYAADGLAAVRCAGDDGRTSDALDALPNAIWSTTPIFAPRARADESEGSAAAAVRAFDAMRSRSLVVVPLESRGSVLGCLAAGSRDRTLSRDDFEMLGELARRIAMALDNATAFEHEHRVAKTLQAAMLPDALPRIDGLRLSSCYVPGKSEADVGGDWFDAFTLADRRVVVSIGDVCGSGLRAAVIMGQLRQAIRAVARLLPDPAHILDSVDRQLQMDAPDVLATAAIVIIDPRTRRAQYAIAGHPRPLVRTPDGDVRELSVAGLPLGIRGEIEPAAVAFDLAPGSLLVLYTDGLIEASRDVVAGDAALRAAVAQRSVAGATDPAQAIYDGVIDARTAGRDDVAILTLDVRALPAAAPARS